MNLLRLITFRKGAAGGVDPDAQAFITAAGITDPTQQSAINQLVLDLKGYSLWTKMTAIYPIVGGTASAHSYNLKNTAQYQITWNGTLTHNSSGVTPTAGMSYGNTGLIPSSVLSLNSAHISAYSSTISGGFDLGGCTDFAQSDRIGFTRNYAGVYYAINQTSGWNFTAINLTAGFAVCSRTGSGGSDCKIYQNSSLHDTGNQPSSGLSTNEIYLMQYNYNNTVTGSNQSSATYSYFSIGDGLNATDVSNLYTAVQAYQTTLGRQV